MNYLMKTTTMEIIDNAKVIVKLIKNDGNTKAIVTLDFGEFKIKWFRVKGDRNGNFWVNPPSIPA